MSSDKSEKESKLTKIVRLINKYDVKKVNEMLFEITQEYKEHSLKSRIIDAKKNICFYRDRITQNNIKIEQYKKEFFDYQNSRFENINIEISNIGPGWYDIISVLLHDIHQINSKDPIIIHVKEKFGTLSIYIENNSFYESLKPAIQKAYDNSSITCEECGEPGKIVDVSNWIKVRCQPCSQ